MNVLFSKPVEAMTPIMMTFLMFSTRLLLVRKSGYIGFKRLCRTLIYKCTVLIQETILNQVEAIQTKMKMIMDNQKDFLIQMMTKMRQGIMLIIDI